MKGLCNLLPLVENLLHSNAKKAVLEHLLGMVASATVKVGGNIKHNHTVTFITVTR